jgi:ATP-binding cassette, subfamily B, bacterial HlyB/CyaB
LELVKFEPKEGPTGGSQAANDLPQELLFLAMIARIHGIACDPEQLAYEFSAMPPQERVARVLLAAKKIGLHAQVKRPSATRMKFIRLPALGIDKSGEFFIIAKIDPGTEKPYLVQSSLQSPPETLSEEQFHAKSSGDIILLTSRASFAGDLAKFDFTWFIPAVVKYRRMLIEVMIVSLVLQVFALTTPLFFQVVMDKVLVHKGFSTLDVIAFGLFVVIIFEVTLSTLRAYLLSHTTSRIDVELGAQLFRHMLALPLNYFKVRRVGDTVARIREIENIRSFLTGSALTLVLDLLFSVVFLSVMAYYSGWLTLIVVVSLPCYFILSIAITPALRNRLNDKFTAGSDSQSFLFETVSGIETVKASAIEPQWRRQWDKHLAAYVKASFRTSVLGSFANSGVMLISKLVTLATMYMGTKLVSGGEISIGQLIAFNMLAGHVAQPVMRMAQMWTDFQQTGVSVRRLGDILNTKTEVSTSKTNLGPIKGSVQLADVTFRYSPTGPEVLKGISLNVAPGEVIGIVGRSGSGKSTIAKLLQRLYVPENGKILIDGVDLATIEASSLRRQIGVVLQENLLFKRTIAANIALSDPGAPIARIMEAAKLAGAHEFITELPEGYDTPIEEHGSNLSGGQRQRIAIARAMLTNPRILILDEATSALDYESEKIIYNNMRAICQGRTVFIVAHRLNAVRGANRIIVIDKGNIAESGSHKELLAKQGGIYQNLHNLQSQ